MKKFICILIIFTMIFSLASCRNSQNENVSSGSSTVILTSSVDTVESQEDTLSQGDVTSENLSEETVSSQPTESSVPSTSSNQSDITNNVKPYTGNLPSISVGEIPQFEEHKFDISGFWAPYEISEESFIQYKDVGFTTLAMINHSLSNNSKNQFYFGSDRTMKALEVCRKVGLKAILNYNDWKAEQCEGAFYYGNTPFSKFDIYGEYKDIITGIHIVDEPYRGHFDIYGDETLIDDFKKVYPNAKYIANLIPYTASSSRGFYSYEEMMELYEQTFMEPFDTPYVSVDVYPFHEGSGYDDGLLALNYEYIANSAKKYGVKPGFILQSSVGGGEFELQLSEGDLRWEINSALAFGADTLQYYCYSVPKSFLADGTESNMYDYCILNRDNTPSPIYYNLQKLHKEIQSFSNVILAYDWNESLGIAGTGDFVGRVSNLVYDENFDTKYFKDPKHYVAAVASEELIISHFTNERYGEAYMFVNFADRKSNSATATFRDCKAVAVYGINCGGNGKIINLDANNQVKFELDYGDGVFVIPLV